ncbi:P-loop containing nucleoside triphosphate hydrolase protein [Catenaria anguillulae PL171]|uniref:p-loop containing nucleoside triphosphate hydrolase protein n=1 Tax=Catenaria anguillulae PL171 TaxID=765915 RepID=A0A1Y2HL72_9FUNG|nr:P-loop containing nucleoside triphosphate hydrolase protein [Catenaria anguillulae PL171]
MQAHLLAVGAQDILSPFPGDSERNLRRVFSQALSHAQAGTPVVLFLDEIDAIAPHRAGASSAMARVVAQLLTLMDGMDKDRSELARLVVVGATNRPNAIDPAVRRPGRLDREVTIQPPPASVRCKILQSMLEKVPTAADVLEPGTEGDGWLRRFAECLPGYVGADLAALVREACQGVVKKKLMAAELGQGQGTQAVITRDDLVRAQAKVSPSLRRGHQVQLAGGRATSWGDIGGLEDVKEELIRAAVWPIERADQFRALGLTPPRGLLLYGPPGCSKTTLVRVLANELRSAFYSLTPADVYSAFVGEAERIVRAAFARARATAPSVLFLDELDALVGGERDQGDGVKHRVLLTLLAEMDGVESGGANDDPSRAVMVVAATNHPGQLDAALIRPGRLDRFVYVRPPTRDEKVDIFKVFTKRMPLSEAVDLEQVVDKIPLATGADIESICREAALASLREGAECVEQRHFDVALDSCHPVITPKTVEYYEGLSQRFK